MVIRPKTIEKIYETIESIPGICFVYKHSSTCPISHTALRQVDAFVTNHKETTILMAEVWSERELCDAIAEEFAIKHESPQLITFKNGRVIDVKNHLSISEQYMNHVVGGGYNRKM